MTLATMTLREAAERRAEAYSKLAEARAKSTKFGGQPGIQLLAQVGVRAEPPRDVGLARSLDFPAQIRARMEKRNGQDMFHLEGLASVVDTPYQMWDFFGPYEETIDRTAFDKTLAASPDVSFLENHRGLSMARTTNDTLILCMGDLSGRTGLKSDAWLNPKRSDVSNLVIAIEDRTITEMSFAFMLNEGWWSEDFETFKITEADINRGDVSAVNYGANPFTSISARSARDIMRELDNLPLGAARAAMSRLKDRTTLADIENRFLGTRADSTDPNEPHNFVDSNQDDKCDVCGKAADAEIHQPEPDADDKAASKPKKKPKYAADPNQPHAFADADKDGKCDVCGKAEGAEIHDPEPDADDPSAQKSTGRKLEDVERAIGQSGRSTRSIIHVEALLAVAEK